MGNKIYYLCDGEKEDCRKRICYKTTGDYEHGCKRTSDIRHAKNFRKNYENVPSAAYREQETAPICGAVRKIMRSWIKMKEYLSHHF